MRLPPGQLNFTWRVTNVVLALGVVCSIGLTNLAAQEELPVVDVTPLTGDVVQGTLHSLSDDSLVLRIENEEKTFDLQNVLTVKMAGREEKVDTQPPGQAVTLTDGSRIHADTTTYDGREFQLNSNLWGELSGDAQTLHHIRFAEEDPATMAKWNDILARDSKQDLLVIRKEESIDFIEGIIGKIDEKAVYFVLDGEEIPVDLAKVFGVVLKRTIEPVKTIGQLLMTNKDRLSLSRLSLAETMLGATTATGLKLAGSVDQVEMIDFRQGRLVYLSELEPRTYEYTPFFDEQWHMRRDENFDQRQIRLGSKTFARGLCIHSKTFVRYRMAGEYRRFQAVMGIEQLVGKNGNVHVVIRADNDVLFEGDVDGEDDPIPLDFEVSGKRDLEILVDFGSGTAIYDHLALADARLVK
jgi:hypothetical protein